MKNRLLIVGFSLLGVAIVAQSQSVEDAVMRLAITLFAFGCSGVLFGQTKFMNGYFGVAAGSFTASDLVAIQLHTNDVWASPMIGVEYRANGEILRALKENQTAQLAELKTGKSNTLNLIWLSACDVTTAAVTADCTLGGVELASNVKEMTLSQDRMSEFFVNHKEWRTNAFTKEDAIAKGLLKASAKLDNYIAEAAVAYLNNFAGVNQYTTGMFGGTGDDELASGSWTADLFSEFNVLAIKNHMDSPYMLSGLNLYKEALNAGWVQGNANNKDQAVKFATMPTYWDLFNIETVNVSDRVTYLINKGAVAIETKTYHDKETPEVFNGAGQTRYTMTSKNFPWIKYDVWYQDICSGSEITHHFRLVATYGIWNNPIGCNSEETGVLRLFNGTQSGS